MEFAARCQPPRPLARVDRGTEQVMATVCRAAARGSLLPSRGGARRTAAE